VFVSYLKLFSKFSCAVQFILSFINFVGSFDLQVHTKKDVDADGWGDVQALEIKNAQEVQLRSFSTSIQNVHTFVSYKSA
jgi:mitotic spindle assembly checkpoint protein MAD2